MALAPAVRAQCYEPSRWADAVAIVAVFTIRQIRRVSRAFSGEVDPVYRRKCGENKNWS
jgi:hypothetical protein